MGSTGRVLGTVQADVYEQGGGVRPGLAERLAAIGGGQQEDDRATSLEDWQGVHLYSCTGVHVYRGTELLG